MKTAKKVLILIILFIIQSIIVIYKIISKFWRNNNGKIKEMVKNLDKELKAEL